MNLEQSLKHLNIYDYLNDILNSNSKGELFHLNQYIIIAEMYSKYNDNEFKILFREYFINTYKLYSKKWKRPQSFFQYFEEIHLNDLKNI